ncbi:UvrD-helicase domain-containing protein [Janthinobacterium agaricidamnosum]|uniref:DNA 3'-5' helicase n=1 Tax=Janthinobacterium agaricidamnosum NBRC 102515 = DSM 9628 TaxID=1349767 RepID=W0V4F2_9BURK|nr:ATP-dependent helicase [Janthinobacterium agaricidamnosum]CDG82238.1 uvrD/REP helicase family protein [Janthinobacterium agaricidamnosum NBRC 102515 = DSM 9628]
MSIANAPGNAPQFIPKRIKPTAEQIAIQTAQKRVVLIDANAGAAKTTTLALRLAEALYRGRQPERMLALVFTHAARVALQQRLADIGVALPVIRRLTIQTFDDFARIVLLKIERAAMPAIDNYEDLRPYAWEALEIVAEKYAHVYPLEIATTNTAIAQFLKLQLRTKARLDFHTPAFEENPLQDNLELLGMSHTNYLWIREYERLRGSDTGGINFRAQFDATFDLVRLLDDDPLLRQQLPEFQIIVADELHDLNEASFRFLTMLIRRSNAFFCGAGDKDQVIYTWSGADHQFLRDRFEQEFPAMQRYPLTASYRYGPELAQSVGLLKHKASVSALARGTQLDVMHYDYLDPAACAAQLLASLQQWLGDGHNFGSVAILLRDRDQSIRVENALFQNNIPYTFVDMQSYLSSQEILMMRGLVAIARKDLHSIKSAQRRTEILEALIVFAEIPFTREELQQAKTDVSNYPDLLEGFLSNQLGKSHNQDKAVLTLAAVEYLRNADAAALAGEALQQVFQLMKLDDTARRIYVDPAQARVVARSIGGFIAVCSEAKIDLAGFSSWLGVMEDGLADIKKQHKVTIACIDQIKGLEYGHVILPYLSIDEFPRSKTDPLEEENRFYVAVTRARDRLTLLTPADASHQSRYIAAMQIDKAVGSGTRLLRKNQARTGIAA